MRATIKLILIGVIIGVLSMVVYAQLPRWTLVVRRWLEQPV